MCFDCIDQRVIGGYEPWTTREQLVMGALASLWDVDPGIIGITCNEPDAVGGRSLSPEMTTRLELLLAAGVLPLDHYNALRHRIADHESPQGIAKREHIGNEEAFQRIRAALQSIIRIIWRDESYTSGPPIRHIKKPADAWNADPPAPPKHPRPSRGHESKKLNRRIAALFARSVLTHG